MRNERRSERAVKKICLTLGAFYKRASIRTFIYRVYNNTKGEKTQSFKHKICRRPSKIYMTTKPHTRYRHNFVPIYQKKRKKNCNMAKNGIYS